MATTGKALVVAGVVAVLALSARCFNPEYPGGLACSAADQCPPGQFCVRGTCAPNRDVCTAVEVCNGIDDDCDFQTDELPGGGTCACKDGDTKPCLTGEIDCGPDHTLSCCGDGVHTCNLAGEWGACERDRSAPEVCDAARHDEDCDGVANPEELCACDEGETAVCGECHDGVTTCTAAGQWGACIGAVAPDPCCPGDSRACGSDTGECQQGLEHCAADGTWTGVCEGAQGPSMELCDALRHDEDCDGFANPAPPCVCNQGDTAACGVCNDGTRTCDITGAWSACMNATTPNPCCPGQTRPCGSSVGECHPGLETCSLDGTWSGVCAGEQGPRTETCEAARRDEDCDGSANENPPCVCTEGQARACGTCNDGTQTCNASGQWGVCNDPVTTCCPGQTRQCGETDTGPCQYGVQTCTATGNWGSCVGAVNPTTESCNAVDDDCDGVVDDPHTISGTCRCELFTGSNYSSLCTTMWWDQYNVPNLGSIGCGDKISSVRCYNGTQVRLYIDSNYGGSSWDIAGFVSTLHTGNYGNLGDNASSARLIPFR